MGPPSSVSGMFIPPVERFSPNSRASSIISCPSTEGARAQLTSHSCFSLSDPAGPSPHFQRGHVQLDVFGHVSTRARACFCPLFMNESYGKRSPMSRLLMYEPLQIHGRTCAARVRPGLKPATTQSCVAVGSRADQSELNQSGGEGRVSVLPLRSVTPPFLPPSLISCLPLSSLLPWKLGRSRWSRWLASRLCG